MPGWLRALSTVNPLSYEVDALRGLLLHSKADLGLDHLVLLAAVVVGVEAASALVAGWPAEPTSYRPRFITWQGGQGSGGTPSWREPMIGSPQPGGRHSTNPVRGIGSITNKGTSSLPYQSNILSVVSRQPGAGIDRSPGHGSVVDSEI